MEVNESRVKVNARSLAIYSTPQHGRCRKEGAPTFPPKTRKQKQGYQRCAVLHHIQQHWDTTQCHRIKTRRRLTPTLRRQCKTLTMQVSKAFRAQLPALRHDQELHLRRWVDNNCAHAVLFRDPNGRCVLKALRDRARTAASHSRTVRATL